MIGRTLGHYRIVEPLGAGGMGEVYRAHDEKLDRDVALKVLPEGALSSDQARQRFRREAHALSRLSHPHIANLYDFDTADGTDFLVMELVRGHSLSEEVGKGGALPEKTVVRLGAQTARGLQAAHEKGVVHRDLKPANLQLTPDGLVKILDFGLARLASTESPGADRSDPTLTAAGHVAGTLPYMSPEQLRGRGVDERTDLYSLGAVLYEIATGRRLFSKPSTAELTEAILNEEPPPPRELNGGLSLLLEMIILKALDKDMALRYQSARELVVDLERLQQRADSRETEAAPTGGPAPRRRPSSSRLWMGVAVAGVAFAVGTGLARVFRPPDPPRVTAVRPLTGDLDLAIAWQRGGEASLTSDAERAYYVASWGGRTNLYQVPLSGGESVEVPLPFGFARRVFGYFPSESALLMSGSNEGRFIVEEAVEGSPLWWVPVPAGAPRRLGNVLAFDADVSPDGRTLAYTREGKLFLAGRAGSDERALFQIHDQPFWARGIQWSPDGKRLRYTGRGPEGRGQDRWIWEVSKGSEQPRPLWPGENGSWTPDGRYYVFQRGSRGSADYPHSYDLLAAREEAWPPWHPSRPTRLTAGPLEYVQAHATRDGRALLAFGFTRRGELLGFDPSTRRFVPVLGGESATFAEPSPDGEWLAWVRYPDGSLWKSRPDGSEGLQLSGLEAFAPRWSRDGQRIAFISVSEDDPQQVVRLVSADGSMTELVARPDDPNNHYWDPCWLPDGSIVFCHLHGPRGVFRWDPETRRVERMPGTERMLGAPKCSPKGDILCTGENWLDYELLRSGASRWESLDKVDLGWPNWTRDGRAFCGMNSATETIDCYSLETGRLETVVEAPGALVTYGSPIPWMGLDADDNPMVTADRSTGAVYALEWDAP